MVMGYAKYAFNYGGGVGIGGGSRCLVIPQFFWIETLTYKELNNLNVKYSKRF